jgi:protein TonB
MGIRRNVVLSFVIHASLLTAAAGFITVKDAVFRVPENYVAVALLEDTIEKKPLSGEKKKGPTKNSLATPRGPESSSPKTFSPMADRQEITPAPVSDEKGPMKENAGIVKDSPFADRGTAEATQRAASSRPSSGTTPMPLSVGAVSQTGQGDNRGGADSRDLGAIVAIRAAIEKAKKYPALARRRGIEGTVTAEFRINSRGMPDEIRITKSSGYSLLDNAAKETIISAAPLPSVTGNIEIPITFRLTRD